MASVYKRPGRQCYTVKVQVGGRFPTLRGFKDKEASLGLGKNIERWAAKQASREPIRGDLLEWFNGLDLRIRRRLQALGLIPNALEARDKPLTAHLADWLADLASTGRDSMYVYNCNHRTAKLLKECGWLRLADIQPESFSRWRAKQTKKAPRTLAQYHDTLRAFLNWAVSVKRLAQNPLLELKPVDWRGRETRKRRALTPAEVDALLDKAGPRALCYKVALYCQLRRADVRALRWGDVNLDTLPAYLVTTAATSKGKRDTRHPLRADLAEELQEAKAAGAGPADKVFPRPPGMKQYRADLEAAGVDYVDERGRQADFHAFTRLTPNTWMANAGVPIRVAMSLMRHTDPKLTTGPYTDSDMLAKAEAVENLPAIGQGRHLRSDPEVIKLEGTTGEPIKKRHHKWHQRNGGKGGTVAAPVGTGKGKHAKNRCSLRSKKAGKMGRLAATGGDCRQKAEAFRGDGKTGPLGLEPRTF